MGDRGDEREAQGALPNMIVIGAMKCASTALHRNLSLHPEIAMSQPKELRFFLKQDPSAEALAAYRSHFNPLAPVRGESTPGYTRGSVYPGVAARMAALIPEARLLYIVRDPIDRICSHWRHLVAARREPRSLERCLDDLDDNPLVDPSLYRAQLDAYLPHFARDRIYVTSLETLRVDPVAEMREIFGFLGVATDFVSPRFQNAIHVSDQRGRARLGATTLARLLRIKRLGTLRSRPRLGPLLFTRQPVPLPVVSDPLRRRLEDRFRDDVAGLREFTGAAFADWSL